MSNGRVDLKKKKMIVIISVILYILFYIYFKASYQILYGKLLYNLEWEVKKILSKIIV